MIVQDKTQLDQLAGRPVQVSPLVCFPLDLSPMQLEQLRSSSPALTLDQVLSMPTTRMPNPLDQFPFEDEHRMGGPLAGYGDTDRNPPQPFPWGGNSGGANGGMMPNLPGLDPNGLGGRTRPRFDPPGPGSGGSYSGFGPFGGNSNNGPPPGNFF